jgi:inorganic pyrophosphatase
LTLVAIAIEASLGKRERYYLDPKSGQWLLDHVDDLPWPVNYGFVPGTLSGDGEPLDAALLNVAGVLATTTVEGHLIGVILRSDGDHKLIAVLPGDPVYGGIDDVASLSPEDRTLLEEFFKQQAPIERWGGPEEAQKILAGARIR